MSEAKLSEQMALAKKLAAVTKRLDAMMPLFQEARDALCAISTVSAKLHGVSPTLADRMDDVGIPERWAAIAKTEK